MSDLGAEKISPVARGKQSLVTLRVDQYLLTLTHCDIILGQPSYCGAVELLRYDTCNARAMLSPELRENVSVSKLHLQNHVYSIVHGTNTTPHLGYPTGIVQLLI